MCYAELGLVIRESGADHSVLEAAFGPLASFMFVWVMVIIVSPAGMATMALTCAHYFVTLFFNDGCGAASNIIVLLLAVFVIRK